MPVEGCDPGAEMADTFAGIDMEIANGKISLTWGSSGLTALELGAMVQPNDRRPFNQVLEV